VGKVRVFQPLILASCWQEETDTRRAGENPRKRKIRRRVGVVSTYSIGEKKKSRALREKKRGMKSTTQNKGEEEREKGSSLSRKKNASVSLPERNELQKKGQGRHA